MLFVLALIMRTKMLDGLYIAVGFCVAKFLIEAVAIKLCLL